MREVIFMHTVVFGDSIAKGIITSNGKLEIIEDNAVKLVSEYYHQSIDNISFYGQTLKRIYEKKLVDKYLKSKNQDDELYAVFALGGNDSDYDWTKVSQDPYFNHESKTSIEDFESMLIEIIRKLKAKGAIVILTTIIPLNSQSYFDNVISKMGDPNQIMIFLKQDIENIYRHQEGYSKAVERCAKQTQSILIDVRSKMMEKKAKNLYMCEDGVHPNEKGYRYIAKSIIKEINQFDALKKWSKRDKHFKKPNLGFRLEKIKMKSDQI